VYKKIVQPPPPIENSEHSSTPLVKWMLTSLKVHIHIL